MQGSIARICTSFIDVPGKIAVAIYFAGCSVRCSGCQNKALWEASSGTKMTVDDIVEKIIQHPLADTVVFLGGEPTDQMDVLIAVCEKITQEGSKELILYTGREFEVLPETLISMLTMIVCGPYRSELGRQGWPASSNQRVFIRKEGSWQC
ncbi:MAG: 4Fe-4S cluster-binding domain-containing protein [Candidatus Babeliales bacterium]|jgi:anaerobic ribonucleoside-triphosphate reductase activating protein